MKKNDAIFLLIASFILVFAWISFNILHNLTTSTIPENTNQQLVPINPNFDMKTVEKLKSRIKITPILNSQSGQSSGEAVTKTQASPTPLINLTPTKIASAEANQGRQGGILP